MHEGVWVKKIVFRMAFLSQATNSFFLQGHMMENVNFFYRSQLEWQIVSVSEGHCEQGFFVSMAGFFHCLFLLLANGFPGFLSLGKNPWV